MFAFVHERSRCFHINLLITPLCFLLRVERSVIRRRLQKGEGREDPSTRREYFCVPVKAWGRWIMFPDSSSIQASMGAARAEIERSLQRSEGRYLDSAPLWSLGVHPHDIKPRVTPKSVTLTKVYLCMCTIDVSGWCMFLLIEGH